MYIFYVETKEWSDGTNEVRTSDVADSKDVAPNNSKPSEPTNAADSKVNSSYSGNNSQEKESKPEVKEQKVEAKIDVAPLLPKPDVDDHFLKMMKEKHMESLTGLKGKLKVEKDRRLQELEDRLMRRKLARKKLLSEGGGTANKEDLEFDEELEKQIQETQVHMEKVEEGLVNGLKKKCLFEMKALKAKGGGTPLTDEEKRIADRLAGQELIKRYERDQKNLLTSLEAQRIKQKNKILERAKLKAAKNKNASNPEGVDDEVAIELQQIDEYFKEQISNAVLEPQNFMFLGLSAINSDVAEEDADNKPNGEDDDDDYFDDDKNSHKKDIKSWINGIEYMTGKYATACKSMQEKLIEAHYEQQANIHEIVDPQKAAIEDGFVDLSGHMLKVLSDAYNKHSHEGDQQDDDYKYGHGKKKSDMDDRIKSGIVNEFEKSKENYNDILSKQRETGKQRLKERRKNKTGAKEECNDVVGAFESMIDSFLEAPTAVSPSQPQPVIRNVPPSSLPTMKDGGQFTTPKTLPPIASKTVLPPVESTNDKGLSASDMRKLHMEKERSLVNYAIIFNCNLLLTIYVFIYYCYLDGYIKYTNDSEKAYFGRSLETQAGTTD